MREESAANLLAGACAGCSRAVRSVVVIAHQRYVNVIRVAYEVRVISANGPISVVSKRGSSNRDSSNVTV